MRKGAPSVQILVPNTFPGQTVQFSFPKIMLTAVSKHKLHDKLRAEARFWHGEMCTCVLFSAGVPGDGHTLGVAVLRGDGFLQLIQLARLLQLLHQALHGLLAPLLLLTVLFPAACSARAARRLLPAQQALHHRRRERQDGGHPRGCLGGAVKRGTWFGKKKRDEINPLPQEGFGKEGHQPKVAERS